MSAPKCLTNVSTTMTIDGIDMHLYGMTVSSVNNPLPAPVESMVSVYGMDGAHDFSRSLSVRYITVEGDIVADNHTTLLTYIDAINKIIRIRETGKPVKLIFSDQPTRYWTVRIQSSDMNYKGLKNYGRSMSYSIRFVCAKPYAEKTTVTALPKRLTIFNTIQIDYQGTIRTPLNIHAENVTYGNLVEDADAWDDTYQSAWLAETNSTVSYTASSEAPYSGYWTKLTRATPGEQSATIDLSSVMEIGYWYKISTYITRNYGDSADLTLELDMGGENIVSEVAIVSSDQQIISLYVHRDFTLSATQFILRLRGADQYIFVAATSVYKVVNKYDAYDYTTVIPYSIVNNTEANPMFRLFRGRNIFRYKNGDTVTGDWSDTNSILSVSKDPIGDTNVLMIQAATDGVMVMSPVVNVNPNTKYHIKLDKYIHRMSGPSVSIGINCYNEESGFYYPVSDPENYDVEDSEYSSYYKLFETPSGATKIRIWIYCAADNTAMYIKNIMVAPEIVSQETAPAYEEPNLQSGRYNDDVVVWDSLSIDSEHGFVRYEDRSTGTVYNAMEDYTGGFFELAPGYNQLRLDDKRSLNADEPEVDSIGTLGVILSYRERYL